jgi:hypothetical protein
LSRAPIGTRADINGPTRVTRVAPIAVSDLRSPAPFDAYICTGHRAVHDADALVLAAELLVSDTFATRLAIFLREVVEPRPIFAFGDCFTPQRRARVVRNRWFRSSHGIGHGEAQRRCGGRRNDMQMLRHPGSPSLDVY